jgi:hypothetical protein
VRIRFKYEKSMFWRNHKCEYENFLFSIFKYDNNSIKSLFGAMKRWNG